MKYYIADPYTEGGLHQLGDDRVEELPDGALRYRAIGSPHSAIAPVDTWTTQWESSVKLAYQCIVKEIEITKRQVETLCQTKSALVESSPELRRLENQLSLF